MTNRNFELPPVSQRQDGEHRRVGFELEFSGIDLAQTVAAVQSALDSRVVSKSAAEVELEVTFKIDTDGLVSVSARDLELPPGVTINNR